ncbi:hypothetical protein MBLNU457_5205t1 [Dothideomycetes sp. NU457]
MFASRTATLARSARAFSTTTPNALARMQLIGRLADVPEQTPTSTGREMVRYALGVSNGPRDESTGQRQTSWFRIASFSEGASKDFLCGLPKGALLYVDADARMDTFQGQDGNNQTRLNLVQRNFEVLSRPRVQNPDETGDSDKSAAEEPGSGLGAS